MAINDVLIYEAGSGGDLLLTSEDLTGASALANQVYLALFGGNIEESTNIELDEQETRSDWWGNYLLKPDNQFNSSFERALQEVALNSAGIRVLENTLKQGLTYLEDYANISVNSEITGLNRVIFYVTLQEPGKDSLKVKLLWDGLRQEAIIEKII